MRLRGLVVVLAAAAILVPARAEAYRPFDGTDADVAPPRVFELELGPVNYYRAAGQNYLIVPALVLNLGLVDGTELVVDANSSVALGTLDPDTSRVQVFGNDVLLKHVFREGTLQDKGGVSIAAEGGVLLPEVNEDPTGFGASLDVITSYRFPWGTFHWNEWFEYTREHNADLYTGLIAEGPYDWPVRPVSEIFYDHDFVEGDTYSALVGAIWRVDDALDLDVGLRGSRQTGVNVAEVRLGLTWSVPLGG